MDMLPEPVLDRILKYLGMLNRLFRGDRAVVPHLFERQAEPFCTKPDVEQFERYLASLSSPGKRPYGGGPLLVLKKDIQSFSFSHHMV